VTTAPDAGLEWSAADKRAVDLIRVLAMDAVQQAGSGHPGTAMSLAPAAALPDFPADAKGMATRKASGEVLNALAPVLPELWGGSEGTARGGYEWFAAQEASYREEVLPARARVSVEAGVALGWRPFVGDAGECVSVEHFGASADYRVLYEEFGITAERVTAAARASLARVAGGNEN
jgi:transketolase